jgi:aminoglycoside 3-N-acetyltransferase
MGDDFNFEPGNLARFAREHLPTLLGEANGKRIISVAREIVATDRWNSFDRFHETNRTLIKAYESAGAKAELYTIPTGGVRGDGKWIIPEAQDVTDATLDLIEPLQRRVLDYRWCPWHVTQWTAATPAEGITCDMVIVDSIEGLARGALAGKFVLSRLDPWKNRRAFCEAGVAGVLFDLPVEGCRGGVAWTKFGWGGLDLWEGATPLVGLSISAEAGDELRALHQQHGRVVVKARVDVKKYAGSHGVVSGLIVGENPDDEIWAVAHNAEPGALDNASGVAVCVEIARMVNELIGQGVLPKPRRTIRLLHGYECYGFFHFLEHAKRLAPPIAGVCIDTVGARPELCAGRLGWHGTVPGSASFVDEIGAAMLGAALEMKEIYRLERMPFVSTEDTLLGDPLFGFPCPWITNHPARGYHSSADTMYGLDEEGLRVCAAAMGGYLYYLASAGTEEALEMARSATERAMTQLREHLPVDSPARREAIRAAHTASIERLVQLVWTGDHASISGGFDAMVEQVEQAAGGRAESGGQGRMALIPRRRLPLAPTLENVWPQVRAKADPDFAKAAIYWANGERPLEEIAGLMSHSLGAPVSAEGVAAHFDLLAELGFVELIDPAEFITEDRLVEDFSKLGLKAGMDVMVHSSMKAIGPVRGGAKAVVRALVKVIGAEGTLLAPSFNHFEAKVFNPLTTPTTNGAIAQVIWQRPDALRSLHPSHAVAAIGRRAAEYVADHLTNGIWAENSPIGRLIHGGGYVLSIGVGHERSTAYHVAEISLGVPCLDQFGSVDRIVDAEGCVKEVAGLAWRDGECPAPPEELNTTLDAVQWTGQVGKAKATLVRAMAIYEARRGQLEGRCARCSIRPTRRS